MDKTEEQVIKLKEKIKKAIHHPYLIDQLGYYSIDENKILFLLSLMEKLDLSENEKEKYIIATMLIQTTLDAHDLVSNDSSSIFHKIRQLTVLAGDYYSGLYYKILANIPNITLIRVFAESIKRVNEVKVDIYNQKFASIDECVRKMEFTETYIFQQLAEYFQQHEWKSLAKTWLFFCKLKNDRNYFYQYLTSDLSFYRSNQAKIEVDHFLNHLMDSYKSKLELNIQQMPEMNDLLKKTIKHHIQIRV